MSRFFQKGFVLGPFYGAEDVILENFLRGYDCTKSTQGEGVELQFWFWKVAKNYNDNITTSPQKYPLFVQPW